MLFIKGALLQSLTFCLRQEYILVEQKIFQITKPNMLSFFLTFQISIGERTIEGSPFSERPLSSHSAFIQHHKSSIFHPTSSIPHSVPEEQNVNEKFQSSFARCLNLPPCAMDQKTWLENELLETRQVNYLMILHILNSIIFHNQ